MAEIINKSQFSQPIPGSQLEAEKYNKDIELLIKAINTTFSDVKESNIQNVSKEVANQTELQAEDKDSIEVGTRYIVVDDTKVNGVGTDQQYVTYVLSDRDLTDGVDKQWIVDSVGVPLATDNNNGLLSKTDFVKLRGLSEGAEYQTAITRLEGLITGNTNRVSSLETLIQTINTHLTNLDNNKQDKALNSDANYTEHTVDGRISEVGGKVSTLEKTSATHGTDIEALKVKTDTTNTQVEENKVGVESNKNEIAKTNGTVAGLGTSKQNEELAYKPGTKVEEQIKANEDKAAAAKLREDNFLKRDNGEMATGYSTAGKGEKAVVPKDEFDDMVAKKEAEIQSLNTELSKKANVSDLGQKPLIYIPGQGASSTGTVTPIIPTVTASGLDYKFDAADWSAWKSIVDPDGKLLINGTNGNVIIKDNDSTTYPGEESYNNGSATKIPFGTDTDAQWNLSDGALVIDTNNQNRDITRTIRQMTFLVESAAGAGVDQSARDDIAKLKLEKQSQAISVVGMNAKTVVGGITELKNAKDALEEKTKGLDYDGTDTTTFAANVKVDGDLETKSFKVDGKDVALKEEILDIISVDEDSDTVGGVRAAIIDSLKDQEGRKSVIFEHAAGMQKTLTYQGAIEKITVDSVEGGPAYFGESTFNKFTNIDDGRPMIWQLFLNIKGWKTWQKTLDDADPRKDGRDDAAIDAIDQAALNALPILQARRETPLNVDNENVLTDAIEQNSFDAMETLIDGGL